MSLSNAVLPSHLPSAARGALRSVLGVYGAPPKHWVGDGFYVHGYFSRLSAEAARALDPFLLLDYHAPYDYAPSDKPRGVGVHPHRGFETVTLSWDGYVAHHDSAGGGGVIGPGDVQWMTAASGVLHKEYHEAEWARRGGRFHMAQLWVNLPKRHKMDPPRYQPITAAQIPTVSLAQGASARVIAGELLGACGPAHTHSPIALLDVQLRAGAEATLPLPAEYNASLLLIRGELTLQQHTALQSGDLAVLARDGEQITLRAEQDAHLLVMAGVPIDEPVVAYGPFVMNDRREIQQAFLDLQQGKFGHLDD